jgi:iron-sulfur cluster repair protein YtfE (RIC family)
MNEGALIMAPIEITPGMTIEEMIEHYPQAASFFLRYGIKCFTCSGIIWGTIEETLRRKGVEDVESTVAELRDYVAKHADADSAGAESCETGL